MDTLKFWSEKKNVMEYLDSLKKLSNNIVFRSLTPEQYLLDIFKKSLPKDKKFDDALLVDIGSGPANASSIFIQKFGFKKLLTIDCSAEMLKLISEYVDVNNLQITTQIADLSKDSFEADEGSADFALSCAVTNYLASLENIFKETSRVLKQGAFFALNTAFHTLNTKDAYLCETPGIEVDFYLHSFFHTKDLWQKYGFEMVLDFEMGEDDRIAKTKAVYFGLILKKK